MSWLNAVIAGAVTYFGSRSEQRQNERNVTLENKESYNWSTRGEAFSRSLDDYYTQRDKADKRAGASEYAKFSSLSQWAPNYQQTYQPPALPSMPTPEGIAEQLPGAK